MAINFPNTPNLNDTHSANNLTWKWDGTTWKVGVTTINAATIPGINTTGTSNFYNLEVANNISVGSSITSSQGFYGDGSNLTGISAFSGSIGITTFEDPNDSTKQLKIDPVLQEIKFLQNNQAGYIQANSGSLSFIVPATKSIAVNSDAAIFGGSNYGDVQLNNGNNGITKVGNSIILNGSSGIITASSFSGSGANLVSIPAGNLVGSLPAIDGSNLTGIAVTGITTTFLELNDTPSAFIANKWVKVNSTATSLELTDAPSGGGGGGSGQGGTAGSGSWTAANNTTQTLDVVANTNLVTEYILYFDHSTGKQSQKILVMHDGSTAYSQEFAIVYTNNLLVSISANYSGNTVSLTALPESGITGSITYKFLRNDVT